MPLRNRIASWRSLRRYEPVRRHQCRCRTARPDCCPGDAPDWPLAKVRSRLSAATACAINSRWSTARSLNNNSGAVSSRAPTPYSTAATCLHTPAQSGHEHSMSISAGLGKSPPSRSMSRSMVPFSKRPCRRSITESIHCEQSRLMALPRALFERPDGDLDRVDFRPGHQGLDLAVLDLQVDHRPIADVAPSARRRLAKSL